MVEGMYHLEDDTGTVKLDLSKSTFHHGLYTHNCIVLVEGSFEDGILYSKTLGLPLVEEASTTR